MAVLKGPILMKKECVCWPQSAPAIEEIPQCNLVTQPVDKVGKSSKKY